MKLLIVDDEELTRTGVISSIDWQSIGIREVLQADDGINGIEVARVHRPDIVLCDVRMPRLDGIAMLEQLEEITPVRVSSSSSTISNFIMNLRYRDSGNYRSPMLSEITVTVKK